MKYQLSSAKKPVAAQKPFDFQAAAEALAESLEHTRDAYDEYVAAEGRVIEVEGVLSDCAQALESISKFGIVAQNMALLNDGNGLDRALGLEDLAIDSLESLSESTKAMLQKQYCAGLENKATEMFSAMVERVKDFFGKLLNWLKELFTSNAKMIKMVSEAKFDNLDFNKKINALSADDCESAIDAMQNCLDNVKDTSKSASQLLGEAKSTFAPDLQKKSGTLQELGWTSAKIGGIVGKFKSAAKPDEMNAAWAAIQKQYKEEIAQNGQDPSMRQKLSDAFANWRAAAKVTGAYTKLLKLTGFSILAVSRATAAAAPAAGGDKK